MDDELRKVFVENLKRYMERANLVQADLVRYMNVSSATASEWLSGKKMPRTDKINMIAKWLGVNMSDLLEDKGEKESPYYLTPETARIAQEVFDNPQLRILFDAARDARPENIQLAAEMLKRFKETNDE